MNEANPYSTSEGRHLPQEARIFRSPAAMVVIVAISVLGIEIALMFAFAWMPPLSSNVQNFLDGALLTLLLAPVLYLFLFRPLRSHVASLRKAEGMLQKQRDHLEEEVLRRTAELEKAREDLEASFLEIDDLYQNAPCGYHSLDREGTFVRINDTELKLLGYSRDEVVGKKRMQDLIVQENPGASSLSVVDALTRQGEMELEFRRKNGTVVPVLAHSSVVMNGNAQVVMTRSTIFDITERRESERLLKENESRFRHIMEHAPIGIGITDLEGRILRVNKAFCNIVGMSKEELEGLPSVDITHEADCEISRQSHVRLLAGEDLVRFEKRFLHREGHEVWVQVTVSLERDTAGAPLYFIGMAEDISERRRSEQKINFMAYHDKLTGLPNRALFSDRLRRSMAQAKRKGKPLALFFLDLDGFKEVNDGHGHDAGDAMLRAVTGRLLTTVRGADTVARLGGDEFAVVLDELEHPQDAAVVAEKIVSRLAEPMTLRSGTACSVGVSIGIAIYPEDASDYDGLMSAADEAMYESKRQGKGAYTYFRSKRSGGDS